MKDVCWPSNQTEASAADAGASVLRVRLYRMQGMVPGLPQIERPRRSRIEAPTNCGRLHRHFVPTQAKTHASSGPRGRACKARIAGLRRTGCLGREDSNFRMAAGKKVLKSAPNSAFSHTV